MAANLGERSLADVHYAGLDEIISELAHVFSDPSGHERHWLGVPVLDNLLQVFAPKASIANDRQPQFESAPAQTFFMDHQAAKDEEMLLHSEALAGSAYRPGESLPAQVPDPYARVPSDLEGTTIQHTPIIEISSSLSASGKSQLLYYLTALAVLPQTYGEIQVGGHEAAVVFIDTDDRFDAERLRTVARDIVSQRRGQTGSTTEAQPRASPDHDLEILLVSSLQHVHIFRPQSSSILLATVRTLDSYLFDLSRHRSAVRPLQMVAIDSATAFLWQDRLREDVARTEEIGRSRADVEREREQKQSFHLTDLYTEVVAGLKQLQSQFQCIIVYTTTASGGRASGPADYDQPQARIPSLKPALPSPWGAFPTLRLVVHRSSVRSFPPSMSAHAAVKDAPSRQSVVQQGKISAWVNPWGRDEWPRRIVEAIEANNGGSFSFYVRDSGVEIVDPDD